MTSLSRRLSLVALLLASPALASERQSGYRAALDSIVAAEMGRTVDDLAGPKFEGREAGTSGGRDAGEYLAEQLRKLPLQPAGENRGYFQTFHGNFRNILAFLPGSDAKEKEQVIVVGAHYDHLGHGRPHSGSPPGTIYPGADDNASGSAGVLQLARAFSLLPQAPKRSILFVFFDGEEKGLLGSKHWTLNSTLPLERINFMLNMDMIGNLRAERVVVFGSRTAAGLRRFACDRNKECGLTLDFSWQMKGNADHYSFFDRGIPTLFLNTDLHERYHQPTDVPASINREGMMRVARLAFSTVDEMADGSVLPRFRKLAKFDDDESRRRMESADALIIRANDPPLRMGIAWHFDECEPDTVVVCNVVPGSPAALAGLHTGDRVYRINNRDFANDAVFAQLARSLPDPLELIVERDGRYRVAVLKPTSGDAKKLVGRREP